MLNLTKRATAKFSVPVTQIYNLLIPFRMWARSLLARFFWVIARVVSVVSSNESDQTKKILFVAKDQLSLDYAITQAKTLRELPNIKCYLAIRTALSKKLKDNQDPTWPFAAHVGFIKALLNQNWDLACFPTHSIGMLFDPRIPKIFSNHGIQSGRTTMGADNYKYGWKALFNSKSSYYHLMLASSAGEEKLLSTASYGRLFRDKIVVTADPAAANLLELNQKRELIRSELGLTSGKKTVILMSSWGPRGLLSKYGAVLLHELNAMGEKYDLFFSAHPLCYSDSKVCSTLQKLEEAGIKLVPPGPSHWSPFLVAADIAVSDSTSLSLYFSLLNKQVLFTKAAIGEALDFSPFHDVYQFSPKVIDELSFLSQIESALEHDHGRAEREAYIRANFAKISDIEHYRKLLTKLAQTKVSSIIKKSVIHAN